MVEPDVVHVTAVRAKSTNIVTNTLIVQRHADNTYMLMIAM